ncbi:MAG: YqiA/YcfP family alpha/beta fold hydrolase [Burkholderiaceae bacterium]
MTPPAPPRATHLLYLHGFRSSPRSAKALRMAQWVAEQRPGLVFAAPQLPPSPREALALMLELTRNWPRESMAVMGSSLGGFYATVLSQQPGFEGCRAALLNPAVDPARDLAAYIGEQQCWQDPDQHFFFRPEFVDELRLLMPDLAAPLLAPGRLCAVIAKGDELLDWHEMLGRYRAAGRVLLLEGSDHGLSDFDDHLPSLIDFLHL